MTDQVNEALETLTQYSAEHGHPADFEAAISTLSALAHPARGVVDEVIAALDQISGLTRALRNGGPAPEDLQELSDALTEATNVAWCASRALQAAQPAVPSVPEGMAEFDSIAVGVRQSLADGDGFWQPCSGCYETEDGQAVGHYPYSATFQCTLGGGCSECGGLGAVWDNNDYNAMLAATPKDQSAQGVDGG